MGKSAARERGRVHEKENKREKLHARKRSPRTQEKDKDRKERAYEGTSKRVRGKAPDGVKKHAKTESALWNS